MSEAAHNTIAPPPSAAAVAPADVSLSPAPRAWLDYGDAMRVLGVLAVVVLHSCDMVMFTTPSGSGLWWYANILDASGRWAVPVFIMLSGALLLAPSRQESAREFYRRRAARLGIAVAFWSAFFMLFAVYYTGWASPKWNPGPNEPASVWKSLLAGAPYVHLHFVFRLGGLYLITPMLRVFVRHAPWGLRAGMAALILGLGMANSIATSFLGTDPSAFVILWPFLGFYLAGNVLREVQVTRRIFAVSCVVFALSWAAMAGGTALLWPPGKPVDYYPSVDLMLYDFLSIPRVAMSLGAWFILAYIFGRVSLDRPVQRFFKWAAPLTLGIYLVHPLIRELLWTAYDKRPLGFGTDLFKWPNQWIGLPVAIGVVAAGSLAMTWVISKVPLLRKTVG